MVGDDKGDGIFGVWVVGGKNGFDIGCVFVEVSGLHLNVARLQIGYLFKVG